MKTLAIIPAGGAGRRMGGSVPKQYLLLAGVPVIVHTLQAFQSASVIDEIYLVVPEGDRPQVAGEVVARHSFTKVSRILAGGAQRQDSVRNALAHVHDEHGIIVIHDGVRPFVSGEMISRVVAAAGQFGAASVGMPVTDTVKEVSPAGWVVKTVPREGLWTVQTPQAFQRPLLQAAYEKAVREGFTGTDDASVVERTGVPVRMIPGENDNLKLTTPGDLPMGEVILRRFSEETASRGISADLEGPSMRIGFGYDSHRLVVGRLLVLGGRVIPHDRGLLGHSDADVLAHAVCDAILGAAGEGDIGRQFPDTDPAYRDASSLLLLERVAILIAEKGYRIVHVDSTIVLERPKIAAYLGEMVKNIADILKISPTRVSVKAKTNEGMGLVGAGEGAAAFAVVTLAEEAAS